MSVRAQSRTHKVVEYKKPCKNSVCDSQSKYILISVMLKETKLVLLH